MLRAMPRETCQCTFMVWFTGCMRRCWLRRDSSVFMLVRLHLYYAIVCTMRPMTAYAKAPYSLYLCVISAGVNFL